MNRRPPACKAGALPAELRPRNWSAGCKKNIGARDLLCAINWNPDSRSPDLRLGSVRPSTMRLHGGCRVASLLRKEVIQPQVPLRLPCYDLVPITGFIFGACLAAPTTSDAPRFGGLTGGVYKAQEHIHRRSADRRLLAIPASCGRVAARNPNWGTIFAIGAALRPGNALSVPL